MAPQLYTIYGLVETRPGHRYFGQVRYVGQTQNLEKRVAGYRKGTGNNKRMTNWLHTCPEFRVQVLGSCVGLKAAWDLEIVEIAKQKTFNSQHGLNYRSGGTGGAMLGAGSRDRIAQSVRQHYVDHPETLSQISERLKSRYRDDPVYRDEMAQRRAAEGADPTHRAVIRERTRAAMQEPEMRARLSKSAQQRWASDGERAANSARGQEYWSSQEARTRQSAGRKAWFASLSEEEKTERRRVRAAKLKETWARKRALKESHG